ncbi:MAG: hypothetical protein AAF253_03600 [Pseudomonadota bacterium]
MDWPRKHDGMDVMKQGKHTVREIRNLLLGLLTIVAFIAAGASAA